MSKYLDAEKLIAEIERRIEINKIGAHNAFRNGKVEALREILEYATSLQQEQPKGNLEYWLEHFGMPKENIDNCITQIAQGYGVCRYLEGVQHGAEAVNELANQGQPEALSNLIDADAVRDDFVREIYRVLDADPTNDRANAIIDAFDSLPTIQQGQPKFKVGDLIVSKYNPHLTYKILATNIPNELGKTDYKVEIFTDGKPGLLGKPHNIRLISSDKIEDWGELVQQEQPEVDLEEEIKKYCRNYYNCNYPDQIQNEGCSPVMPHIVEAARHFAEWGAIHLNARKEE